jgi:transposase-like protein
VIFIDAVHVKIRDGQVANRPIYVAIGVTVDGERDILGLWVGTGGEGAKYWLQVLTEIKNRGVEDVCIVVCDGLNRRYDWNGRMVKINATRSDRSLASGKYHSLTKNGSLSG